MNIGDRIKTIRNSLEGKVTQTDFGNRLGVAREVITSYEIGRVIPPEPTIRLIASTFNVNYLWLKTGEGPMHLPPESDIDIILEVMGSGNEFAKRVFKSFAKLNDEGWKVIKTLVDELSKED